MEMPHAGVFERGRSYERREIRDVLGGSARAMLVTRGGRVVCVCATREKNPRAPEEILIGGGEAAARQAKGFVASGDPVPVFVRERGRAWFFAGSWRASRLLDDAGEVACRSTGSRLEGAAMVLVMEECPGGDRPVPGDRPERG